MLHDRPRMLTRDLLAVVHPVIIRWNWCSCDVMNVN